MKWKIKNKYPNYVKPIVFRIGFIFILVFTLLSIGLYGFNTKWVNVQCNSPTGSCINPFTYCSNASVFDNKFDCNFYNSLECKGHNCNTYKIKTGDYIGEKAPPLVKNGIGIIFIITLITILINHLIYLRGKKHEI